MAENFDAAAQVIASRFLTYGPRRAAPYDPDMELELLHGLLEEAETYESLSLAHLALLETIADLNAWMKAGNTPPKAWETKK